MREYLVFRLYGPLSSWGDTAVGEYRPSFSYPTKSAISGLVSAALGIARVDEELLQQVSEGLLFSLLVHSTGSLLRDYHTIQTPGKTDRVLSTRADELIDRESTPTILSTRDYRSDALYDVALSATDASDISLEQIQQALNTPRYLLYLGRKSCPLALPLKPSIISAASSLAALRDYDAQYTAMLAEAGIKNPLGSLHANSSAIYLWEEDNDIAPDSRPIRRDAPLSRKRWQFSEREEKYKMLPIQE